MKNGNNKYLKNGDKKYYFERKINVITINLN